MVLGSEIRIRIPDPGVKKHPITDPDPQHCLFALHPLYYKSEQINTKMIIIIYLCLRNGKLLVPTLFLFGVKSQVFFV
jgi:hypothetical protein